MKRILILVQVIGLTALMTFNTGCSNKKGSNSDQLYGEKSGIITFKPMEMMGVKVNQTMYFDDFGKKEVRELIVEGAMMGNQMRQHTIDIRDGNTIYHYEIESIEGGVNKATKNAYKSDLTPEMTEKMNMTNMSEAMKAKLQFKEIGKETVAGLDGIKYTICPDSTSPQNIITGVHYKNIPLKVSMGPMVLEVEKIDFNTKIPAEKFKVPADYTIVDRPEAGMPQMPAETTESEESNEGDVERK